MERLIKNRNISNQLFHGIFAITLVLLSISTIPIFSQNIKVDSFANTQWLTLGAGLTSGQKGGIATVEYSVQKSQKLYSGRMTLLYYGIEEYGYQEFSFLFGRATLPSTRNAVVIPSTGHAVVSVGPSLLFKSFSLRDPTLGLAVSMQFFIRGPNVGIGLYLFGNLNKINPTVGVCAGLQFGKLKIRGT